MCYVPLTPTDDRPMNAISCVVRLDKSVVMCGCRDGRVFVVDLESHELIRSLRAHRSWISAMDVDSRGHCVIGSYDTTATLYRVASGREKLEHLFCFTGHKDYVTAVCLAENWFFTASSDHTAYQISLDTGHKIAIKISTHSTVHAMRALQTKERFLVMGYADGVVELRQYDNFEVVKAKLELSSCVTAIFVGKDVSYIGCLDGSVYSVEMPALKRLQKVYDTHAKVLTIEPSHTGRPVVVTANGDIFGIGEPEEVALGKRMTAACALDLKLRRMAFACEDGTLLSRNSHGVSVLLPAGVRYKKAQRLPHSSQVLCMTSNKSVQLWNPVTRNMEADFGQVKFRNKLKELSKSPSVHYPFSVDITTGQVVLVFENIRKIYYPKYLQQFLELRRILAAAIDQKAEFYMVTDDGRALWNGKGCPGCVRYFLECEPDVSPFKS